MILRSLVRIVKPAVENLGNLVGSECFGSARLGLVKFCQSCKLEIWIGKKYGTQL